MLCPCLPSRPRSFHPLLTPSGCAGGARMLLDPPLSPQQAADIYAGGLRGRVLGGAQEDLLRASCDCGRRGCPGQTRAASSRRYVFALHPMRAQTNQPQQTGPPSRPRSPPDPAGKLEPVALDTLRGAQRISRFAVAAYGLQSVIWAKGQ